MNRRSFLGLFGAAAVLGAVNRKYFFAPSGGWDNTAYELSKWNLKDHLYLFDAQRVILPGGWVKPLEAVSFTSKEGATAVEVESIQKVLWDQKIEKIKLNHGVA